MLFHIAPRQAWETPPYEPSSLADEGFIHFSTAAQVVRTAQRRFAGVDGLVLLVVDDEKTGPWKVEDSFGAGEAFPHLYAPLDRDVVRAVLPFAEPFALPVALAEVTRENVRAVCELRLAPGQETLVAPASFTVAEGHYEPGALLRAIVIGGLPVGVALVEVEDDAPYLVRFMVDQRAQGAGIGTRAARLLEDELRGAGQRALEVSFQPGARGFWERCGFTDTGRVVHGEPRYRKGL